MCWLGVPCFQTKQQFRFSDFTDFPLPCLIVKLYMFIIRDSNEDGSFLVILLKWFGQDSEQLLDTLSVNVAQQALRSQRI